MLTRTESPDDLDTLDERALLTHVMRPYKPHCRYLLSATAMAEPHIDDGAHVLARGELSIPESCYIDDTGHLNAVEFNICYNQLAYFAVARGIQSQLSPMFAGWSMADYRDKQLPDMLIARLESRFRRAVNPRAFHGEVRLKRAKLSGRGGSRLLMIRTEARFFDDDGGLCDGDVLLAFVNPPAAADAHRKGPP